MAVLETILLPREEEQQYSTDNCTAVTPECPVELTIYGYYPSLGANAFFLAIFAICFIANTVLGLRFKTWTYLIAMFFGTLAEAIGYAGRIMLHDNPWSSNGFQIQICCLIIAPAFIAAGVYLTLKHIVLEIGSDFSRLPPRYYTWIFILCDIFSLVLQGAGGGIAATADTDPSLQDTGTNLMIAGIIWQVVTLFIFGGLVGDYAYRAYKRRNNLSASAVKLLGTRRFKFFAASLILAFLTIFARCVYRIAEMVGGWQNDIMQSEPDFIALDSVMILIATLCLTIFHPGIAFPEMQMHGIKNMTGAVNAEKVADPENTPAESTVAVNKGGYFGAA
ncbi:MAG: hypothetical protein Q9217_006427 [Psora testacea]